MRYDILYVEGPGDIVAAFDSWLADAEFASETAVTYSSQMFSFCKSHGQSLLAISYGRGTPSRQSANIRAESRPRRMLNIPKVGYSLSRLWYACRIFGWALRYRPRLILLTSGVVSWNVARIFSWTGADVVPILHNSLWPEGFKPSRPRDTAWWSSRRPPLTLAVSDTIGRQLALLNKAARARTIQFRPSFAESQFPEGALKSHAEQPFRIVFAGRLEADKGVFDLVEVTAALERTSPGTFHIDICGSGSQATALAAVIRERGLGSMITLWGRLDRQDLLRRYEQAHVCIVPTRSSFSEGFAQVVAESILLLRPVVTSAVVPAGELYKGAVLLATTDDPMSYVTVLRRLAGDARAYALASAACLTWRTAILGRDTSFHAAMVDLDRRRRAQWMPS